MIDWLQRIFKLGDYATERTFGATRSPLWSTVRNNHLIKEPLCQLCGGKTKLNVHHILPFHMNPELELDPNNLITLCNGSSGTISCHIRFGHFDNFRTKWNPTIRDEVPLWRMRFAAADMTACTPPQ